jgi:hypothetical protein
MLDESKRRILTGLVLENFLTNTKKETTCKGAEDQLRKKGTKCSELNVSRPAALRREGLWW